MWVQRRILPRKPRRNVTSIQQFPDLVPRNGRNTPFTMGLIACRWAMGGRDHRLSPLPASTRTLDLWNRRLLTCRDQLPEEPASSDPTDLFLAAESSTICSSTDKYRT